MSEKKEGEKIVKSYLLKVELTESSRLLYHVENNGFAITELLGILSRVQYQLHKESESDFKNTVSKN